MLLLLLFELREIVMSFLLTFDCLLDADGEQCNDDLGGHEHELNARSSIWNDFILTIDFILDIAL